MSRASIPRSPTPATGWDAEMSAVARTLPAVLDGLRASYRELEERAARVERELAEANRERGELAERLHAADKLSALGTMAAGIAHEIRNPLNAVRGFAELLAKRVESDERAAQWSRHIVAGVCEADAIIENLLSFGSPQRLRIEAVDARELLEHAARLALVQRPADSPTSEARPAPDMRLSAGLSSFRGDGIKLRQAVRNLIENALQAQAESATPRVEAEVALDGQQVVFRVSDAGPGVSADLRTRILDPFFTTHADGTGLGLALVSVIARLHGGSVQCSSRPSALGGALFELRIPFQPADPPAASPQTSRQ